MTNTEMVSKLLKGQQVHSHSQVMEAVMHRSKKIADLPVMSLDPKEFQAYIGLSKKTIGQLSDAVDDFIRDTM